MSAEPAFDKLPSHNMPIRPNTPIEVVGTRNWIATQVQRHGLGFDVLEDLTEMVTPKDYVCAECHSQYPVPSMARDCERKHGKEENDEG